MIKNYLAHLATSKSHQLLLGLGIFMLTMLSLNFASPPRASAYSLPVGIPNNVAPQWMIDSVANHCDPNGPYKYNTFQDEWLSLQGDPAQTQVASVNVNDPYLMLQINYITYNCAGKYIDRSTIQVQPGSGFGLPDGLVAALEHVHGSPGYKTGLVQGFDSGGGWFNGVYKAGPFYNTQTYTLPLRAKGILNRTPPGGPNNIYCAQTDDNSDFIALSSDTYFNRCHTGLSNLTLNVVVEVRYVSGRVYNVVTGQGADTAMIHFCNGSIGWMGYIFTDSNGYWKVAVPIHSSFCVYVVNVNSPYSVNASPGGNNRIPSGWQIPSYGSGYDFTNNKPENRYDSSNNPITTYEWQVANDSCYKNSACGAGPQVWDLTSDSSFDFKYVNKASMCTIAATPDTTVEPGSNVSVTITITNKASNPINLGGGASDTKATWNAGSLGATIPKFIGAIPTGGTYTQTIAATNPAIGRYPLSLTLKAPGVPDINCNRTISVASKPYLKVNNGDVAAGLTNTCAGWDPAPTPLAGVAGPGTINAWNQLSYTPAGPPDLGAGTNLAVYAINQIDGFTSSQPPSGSSPPVGLTFANASGTGTYGGSFGSGIDCPTNYWQSSTGVSTPGPMTIGSPLTLTEPTTKYVDGNVYIKSNIYLATAGPYTAYNLPSYKLIVRGNIYIASNVTNLDGLYVAQGGNIYTCSNVAVNGPPLTTDLNGACRNRLIVNGAFIAKEVKLYRSNGTLKDATNPNSVAEQFNYTPNVWLAPATTTDGRPTFSTKYDAIISMPPVL